MCRITLCSGKCDSTGCRFFESTLSSAVI